MLCRVRDELRFSKLPFEWLFFNLVQNISLLHIMSNQSPTFDFLMKRYMQKWPCLEVGF